MAKRVLHIDATLCMGCKTCQGVCEFIHRGVPLVRVYEPLKGIFMPIVCRHCEKASCVEVCPTHALYKDEEGVVLVNSSKCIGCLMCLAVCPFGAPMLDSRTRTIVKCDMCADLRAQGVPPACASACPAAAIAYGTIEEVGDKIRRRTAEVLVRTRFMPGYTLFRVP